MNISKPSGPRIAVAYGDLGGDLAAVRHALDRSGVTVVMELMLRVDQHGQTEAGQPPLAVLTANLPAITGLRCTCVHFHFVPLDAVTSDAIPILEQRLTSALAACARRGVEHGFRLGLEHNAYEGRLFVAPNACARALATVPELSFVWDLNHTSSQHVDQFAALVPRTSMVHVADTRLPEVNEHLPLGEGTIDFRQYCRRLKEGGFTGPAILEIGGLPKSGGFNRDTDAALIRSREQLMLANQ